jgi:hypothetical protein
MFTFAMFWMLGLGLGCLGLMLAMLWAVAGIERALASPYVGCRAPLQRSESGCSVWVKS